MFQTVKTYTYSCDLCHLTTATYEELIHIPVSGLPAYVDVCGSCNNEPMHHLTRYILGALANVDTALVKA